MVIMDGTLTFHSKTSKTRNLYFGTDLYLNLRYTKGILFLCGFYKTLLTKSINPTKDV